MKNPDGSYTIQENSTSSLDGTDLVTNAEFLCFDDGLFSIEEIDNNYLTHGSGGGGNGPYELGEIIADDTDDWIQAISEDSNFDDIDPNNWMEDIELESIANKNQSTEDTLTMKRHNLFWAFILITFTLFMLTFAMFQLLDSLLLLSNRIENLEQRLLEQHQTSCKNL